jgi:hypothetical protein
MIVEGINDDRSMSVRNICSRDIVGAATTLEWLTADLTGAKTITYAQPAGIVGSEFAVFVDNSVPDQIMNIDCYAVQGGVDYLLTSFSVAAASSKMVRVSDLFVGGSGCKVKCTPAAALDNEETLVITVIEAL